MQLERPIKGYSCRNIGDEGCQYEPFRVNKWVLEQVTLAASERANEQSINLKTASRRHARKRVPFKHDSSARRRLAEQGTYCIERHAEWAII
jgi:hypothetical protein